MTPESTVPLPETLAEATSELNNLLQIISGTTSLIENACKDKEISENYLAMMRASIARAEKVTAELAKRAGGSNERTLTNPDLAAFARKSNPGSEMRKTSIVLVDDEQMTLTVVSRILTEAGYQVTTAQSGFECIDAVRRRPYDFNLALLDLSMPFMDGEETFNRLREIRPDLPVIMCTGFIQQEKLKRLMDAGLAGFLRKPLSPAEIVGQVRSTLAGMKYCREQMSSDGIPAII
ncbi:MAG: response regulator [Verrucomicrobiota bacterium]